MRHTFPMQGSTTANSGVQISDSMPDMYKALYAYVSVFTDAACTVPSTSPTGTVTFTASPDFGVTYYAINNGSINLASLAADGAISLDGCVNNLKATFASVTGAPYYKIKIVRY